MWTHVVTVAAAFAITTSALATYNPGPSYAVAIPSTSGNDSDIYIQITSPSSYQWTGIGIGSQMAGSHIMVMYTDGNGNVTVSGRAGTGHREPNVDSTMEVEVLQGSQAGDMVTANVRCVGCTRYLDSSTDTASNWIAAWKEGDALNSADVNEDISQHDTHKQFNLDLTKASVTSAGNPFIGDASMNATTAAASNGTAEDTNAAATTTGGGDDEMEHTVVKYDRAHGISMAIAVLILFPLGALVMPLLGSVIAHAGLQLFALALFTAAFGLGVHLADLTDQLLNNTHTQLGLAIFILLLLQPIGGALHHWRYRKAQVSPQRKIARGHRWLGRITLILAFINGGLGLKLAGGTKGLKIAWGVVAGVVGLIWIAVSVITSLKKRKEGKKSGHANGHGNDHGLGAKTASSEKDVVGGA